MCNQYMASGFPSVEEFENAPKRIRISWEEANDRVYKGLVEHMKNEHPFELSVATYGKGVKE